MISVFKNNFSRFIHRKVMIIAILVLTIGAIVAAIFISSKTKTVANIAFVSQRDSFEMESLDKEYPNLNLILLHEPPEMSEMVSGKYDAIVAENADSTYDIQTIKSDEIAGTIEDILYHRLDNVQQSIQSRGVGTTILGYLVMFILMEASMLMFLFSDDKEHKQIIRVAASPISFTGFLAAHSSFTFTFLFCPTIIILFVIKFIFGRNLGFSYLQYTLLIALICAFATAFTLFLHSFFDKSDTANMAGSVIIILTSVLAGSFYSFDKGNKMLEQIIRFLPQKSYLTLVDKIERGMHWGEIYIQLLYILVLTLVFFGFAIIITRNNYVKRH